MKKLLLSAAIAAGILSANAQHMTLHELFTGENCGPCAVNNPPMWVLCDANASKLLHITYMTPIPTTGVFYQSQSAVSAGRRTYYNVNSAPHGKFDGNAAGTGFPTAANFTQAHIDAQAAVASPFTVKATHYFNATNDTVFGSVTIKAVTPTYGSMYKLRAAFTKTMHFTASPGSNGEKDYPNVVRAMFTAVSANGGYVGQPIAANWATGDSIVYKYKGRISKLDSALAVSKPFTKVDSNFFVWIQNDTTAGTNAKMVLVAGQSIYQVPVVTPPAGMTTPTALIADINIFPNPAANFVAITCNFQVASAAKLTITNVAGQVVAEKEYKNFSKQFSDNIALDKLSNGIYQMSIAAGTEVVTKQFAVNK